MDGNFKDLFRKFCMETSILGFKYFYIYPDKISRCFWAITMLTITYAACSLNSLLYNRFGEIPTRITIENQYEPLLNVPFPAITICSPNQITISAMRHFNRTLVDGNLTLDLEKALPQLLGFYTPLLRDDDDVLDHLQSLIDLNRYTVPEVMTSLPQRCEDFLRMCIFHRQLFPNCRGLLRPILTSHGLCCVFNSVYYFKDGRRNEKDPDFTSRKVKTTRYAEGLTVVTDYNPADALDRTIVNAGSVRVMFNDVSEFPSDDEMKLVRPHSESFHVIHATYTYCSEEVEQLPAWRRECYFKDEHSLPFFGDYHNADCDTLCFVKAVENECRCQLFHVPYLRVGRTCNVTSIACILKVKYEHSLSLFGNYHNADCDTLCYVKAVENVCRCQLFHVPYLRMGRTCNVTSIACILKVKLHVYRYVAPEECDCPRDCDFRRYQTDTSMGNFDALPYVINKPYSRLVFNKSTSMMHFFFTSPVYVKQKQETVMSLITLTSNLGGVFGLCLGCSAISVLEISFFTYIAIRNYIRRVRRCVYPVIN